MRISDWSSDVCSSDLTGEHVRIGHVDAGGRFGDRDQRHGLGEFGAFERLLNRLYLFCTRRVGLSRGRDGASLEVNLADCLGVASDLADDLRPANVDGFRADPLEVSGT